MAAKDIHWDFLPLVLAHHAPLPALSTATAMAPAAHQCLPSSLRSTHTTSPHTSPVCTPLSHAHIRSHATVASTPHGSKHNTAVLPAGSVAASIVLSVARLACLVPDAVSPACGAHLVMGLDCGSPEIGAKTACSMQHAVPSAQVCSCVHIAFLCAHRTLSKWLSCTAVNDNPVCFCQSTTFRMPTAA